MMAVTINKETFQRLTLLYLIGFFKEGVYSSFRLQKVLYYATREIEPKPFTFHHTRYGQYSRDASMVLLHLFESDLLQRDNPSGVFGGARWKTRDTAAFKEFREAFEEGLPNHATAIRDSVHQLGFLKQRELDEKVHRDPLLQVKRRGCVLIRENKEKRIRIALDEDIAEELELMLSPFFLQSQAQLDAAVAKTEFNLNQVRTVQSIDSLV